jgi:hypothetical protein
MVMRPEVETKKRSEEPLERRRQVYLRSSQPPQCLRTLRTTCSVPSVIGAFHRTWLRDILNAVVPALSLASAQTLGAGRVRFPSLSKGARTRPALTCPCECPDTHMCGFSLPRKFVAGVQRGNYCNMRGSRSAPAHAVL